jgi:hypothetical protein
VNDSSNDAAGSHDSGSSTDASEINDIQQDIAVSGEGDSGDDTAVTPADPEPTVGTGSVLGIGCTIFAVLFILIAVCIFMVRQIS